METSTVSRPCLSCGKTVRGRADKKFCDDACRNVFNNQLKGDRNNFVRNINNTLLRNRRIMAAILPEKEEMAKATREVLLQKGFQFKYFTHVYNNKRGNTYYFCYEYGWLPLENEWYLLVKRKE